MGCTELGEKGFFNFLCAVAILESLFFVHHRFYRKNSHQKNNEPAQHLKLKCQSATRQRVKCENQHK